MDFFKLAAERYSVRSFENRHLEQDVIDRMLAVSHLAPTGCNYQTQRILVLNTDESLAKLRTCTKSHFNAPCAMVVCCDVDESWERPYDGALSAPVDAAIVATYLMLAAWELGVGSTWVMHFNSEKLVNTFDFPDSVQPIAILMMGYPAPDAKPHPYHSAFRPLDEVVFYEDF